jgi:hypothetical protein
MIFGDAMRCALREPVPAAQYRQCRNRPPPCATCGHKGAALQHPGWVDSVGGFQPFHAVMKKPERND